MSATDIVFAASIVAAFAILFYYAPFDRRWRSRDGKVRVSIEKVEAAREYLKAVNDIPLEDIVWTRQGRDIEVADETVKDWKFVGLSNAEFVELRLNGEQE